MMVLATSGNFCPNPNIPVVSRTTVVINPANKTGIVIWGSSNANTHGHEHNINLEAVRHCGKPPCIDLGGFIVDDITNQECCLMPKNAKSDSWPLIEDVIHEINTLIK